MSFTTGRDVTLRYVTWRLLVVIQNKPWFDQGTVGGPPYPSFLSYATTFFFSKLYDLRSKYQTRENLVVLRLLLPVVLLHFIMFSCFCLANGISTHIRFLFDSDSSFRAYLAAAYVWLSLIKIWDSYKKRGLNIHLSFIKHTCAWLGTAESASATSPKPTFQS